MTKEFNSTHFTLLSPASGLLQFFSFLCRFGLQIRVVQHSCKMNTAIISHLDRSDNSGRIKLVIKTAMILKKVVRNKLSFTFSMWEEKKYYCRLFLQLFCGPRVLSLWFLSGKFLWWQSSLEEYKWDEQRAEQKLFSWNTSKTRRLASSSSIEYSTC